MDGGLPSQSPIFYILWSGLYFSKKQNGNHFMWAINLFIGLSPTSSKSTTNSSLASLLLATVSFPSEFESGELIVNNWPLSPFTLPCTCSYTLFTEICDERGRKYNYIVGRVVWVAGLVALPFVGLWKIFILWKKNFFDEYTYSSKKPRRLVLFWDGVSQHEHCVCFSSPLPPGESEVANQPKEIFWGGWTYQWN